MSHITQNTRAQRQAQEAERKASAKPKPPESEADIQRKIKHWLDRLGAIPIRINSGNITMPDGRHINLAPPGTSDLIGALPTMTSAGLVAIFFAIEVKKPGNKPTGLQQKFLDKVKALGGIAFWATSVADAREQLQAELKARFGVSNEYKE